MRIIQTSGLKTLKTHVDELGKSVKDSVDAMLRNALAMDSIGDAFKTVRQLTTDGFIMNTIASFMVSLPNDTVLPSKVVSAQVVSRSGSLFISEAMIMSEVGALNAGNGIGEPGEWVEIGLMVKNGSKIPWYSTSIFPESVSPNCLWIRKGEIEPGEFLKKGSQKAIRIWGFIPETCSASPRLKVTFRDTHRSPKGIRPSSNSPAFVKQSQKS